MNRVTHSPLYRRLIMVGCGKMGMALLTRWVAQGVAESFLVIEPSEARHGEIEALGETVRCASIYEGEPLSAEDTLLFAVKPQVAPQILAEYQTALGEGVLLSVMAGLSAQKLAEYIGNDAAKIIRVMPNTPAMIGQGVSVCYGSQSTDEDDRARALALLSAVGEAHWVGDESLMHAVTGLSGSGPAYVFHMIEAMSKAGIAAGLDETLARQLAIGTVKGAGMLAHASEDSPTTLRENVTSPNGTTQAGLEVLMKEEALERLMGQVVGAAAKRSRELSE